MLCAQQSSCTAEIEDTTMLSIFSRLIRDYNNKQKCGGIDL